jgi:hypothetical protein
MYHFYAMGEGKTDFAPEIVMGTVYLLVSLSEKECTM